MPNYLNDPTLNQPIFPGSHIALDDHYAFISGLTVMDIPGGETVLGDIHEETRWVMRRLVKTLEYAGCDIADTVRVDIHLTNLDNAQQVDAVYAEFFNHDRYPARTCTESPRLYDGSHIEITLMARRPHKPKDNEDDVNGKRGDR